MSNDDLVEDDCSGIEDQEANLILELWAEVERLRAENEALRSGLAVAYQMLGAKP